jgi:hypothetical protein
VSSHDATSDPCRSKWNLHGRPPKPYLVGRPVNLREGLRVPQPSRLSGKGLALDQYKRHGLNKRGRESSVAQMGWERRGNNLYFYRKEREGSRVKSIYVGRGEIAKMISQFQSSSSVIEKLACQTNTANDIQSARPVVLFEQVIQLLEQAALITAGFHTHHRQWRRKRNAGKY